MTLNRRSLALVASLLLAAHALGGLAVPIVLACAPSADGAEAACTCAHGPDAECPMHKHRPAPSPGPHCRGCARTDEAIAVPFFAWGGVLPPRADVPVRRETSDAFGTAPQAVIDMAYIPVSPPPERPELARLVL